MAYQATDPQESISCRRDGITFNAEGVSLIAQFEDELSAYRAKKNWVTTLHTSFLLQRDKDYELEIKGSVEEGSFSAQCKFTSPCGRYAFWRLINQQAPETERKLARIANPNLDTTSPSVLGKLKEKLTPVTPPSNVLEEPRRGFFGRIFSVFI